MAGRVVSHQEDCPMPILCRPQQPAQQTTEEEEG